MKRNNKKGFTIIELVVVIAVIAILAAVLIPTFSSIIKKANISADEQAVYQMNTALSIYTAENGKPKTALDVKKALAENGINADTLVPVTQGYAFYWDNTNNKIVLVGKDKATAQTGWELLTSTGYGVEPTTAVTDYNSLTAAIEQSSTTEPVLVKLEQDLSFDENTTLLSSGKGVFCVGQGKSLIIDANGHTITSEVPATNKSNNNSAINLFRVDDGGQLVVKNATIQAKGYVFRNGSSTLRLENVKITIDNPSCNNTSCVFVDGLSDTYIVNSELEDKNSYAITANSSKDTSDGARISIINTKVKTTAEGYAAIYMPIYANVTIDNCIIEGKAFGAYFRGCNATITNSKIYNTDADGSYTAETWTGGAKGYTADIVFAASASGSGYISTGTYVCENVTGNPDSSAKNSEFNVIVHQPEGAKVTVSGISVDKTFTKTSFDEEPWDSTN